jgi:broad specificity phosphatase PhoE
LKPWFLWRDGAPGGESPSQIGRRVDRLLDSLRDDLERGDVVRISHGHLSRVVGARWLGQPTAFGASLIYDTARICILDHEHQIAGIRLWNADPRDPAASG